MTVTRRLRTGGLHATSYSTSYTTSQTTSRSTGFSWSETAWRETSSPEYVQYVTSQSAGGWVNYTSSWETGYTLPYSYSSSWTTEWHSWAPGDRPYYATSWVSVPYEASRYTYFKFYEDGWDTFWTTYYLSQTLVVAGYYNTDITHTAETSVTVNGTTSYSWTTSVPVQYYSSYETSWYTGYYSYNYWDTAYQTTYSTGFDTEYTTSWTTSHITSRSTSW